LATMSSVGVHANDDIPTICAISLLAGIVANIFHEGVGHAAIALLTGTKSGVLTTVAWSSDVDSRIVAAGGTLANLAAALFFWIALRSRTAVSVRWRFFLLTCLAFNLLDGTGYFLFSGLTNFGDWAVVIAGLQPHWFWQVLLVVVGIVSYYASALAVGIGLVRYVGIPKNDFRRLKKLTFVPYFSSILLLSAGSLLNPIGMQLLWQSALPASAGGHSGLLWLMYPIPKGSVPERPPEGIGRNYAWITGATALTAAFVLVLGRGITVHR